MGYRGRRELEANCRMQNVNAEDDGGIVGFIYVRVWSEDCIACSHTFKFPDSWSGSCNLQCGGYDGLSEIR